jgi:urease accessory protein
MTPSRRLLVFSTLAFGALAPSLASAHPGHAEASTFVAGMLHPLSGVEHIAALFVAGLLAARLGLHYLLPTSAAFLGLLVAAWTADTDGWRYAAGFALSGAVVIVCGIVAASLGRAGPSVGRLPISNARAR